MNKNSKQSIVKIGAITLVAIISLIIKQIPSTPEKSISTLSEQTGSMEVHFIDVGQGDSILVEADNSYMLIDAGENNKGSVVLDYLEKQNIKKLDYVIGTHPHSDHIGGLDTIIQSIPVDKVIMPDIVHTTDTFEDVLDVMEEKDLTLTKAVAGDEYSLGMADFEIIAPNSPSYKELNNYSIVIKLKFGDNSFLLTGDSEKLSEEEILKNGTDLSCDVIKLGHHGSSYSSSDEFLDEVKPEYAVVSAGADNKYGHPHSEILQEMKERNIKLYRTDEQGTIVFTSDGSNISVNQEAYIITEEDLNDR